MILFANFLISFARIIHLVLMIYVWIIVFRAILSWIRIPSSFYSVAIVLYKLTEPVLKPLRRIVPPSRPGGIDISPMIVILIIIFIDSFLIKSIYTYGYQLLRQHRVYF